MTASEMVRSALAGAGKTQKELAEYMGWSPQNLSGRLKADMKRRKNGGIG